MLLWKLEKYHKEAISVLAKDTRKNVNIAASAHTRMHALAHLPEYRHINVLRWWFQQFSVSRCWDGMATAVYPRQKFCTNLIRESTADEMNRLILRAAQNITRWSAYYLSAALHYDKIETWLSTATPAVFVIIIKLLKKVKICLWMVGMF